MDEQNQQQTFPPQQPPIPPQNVNPVPPPQHKNWIKWVLIIVFVVLLASITTYFVLTFQSQKPPPPQIVQTTPSPTPDLYTEGTRSATANWKTYTDKELEVSLKHPSTYKPIYKNGIFRLESIDLKEEYFDEDVEGGGSFIVTKGGVLTVSRSQLTYLIKQEDACRPGGGVRILSCEPTVLDGIPAMKRIDRAPENSTHTHIFALVGNYHYSVGYNYANSDKSTEKLLYQILSTFRFD